MYVHKFNVCKLSNDFLAICHSKACTCGSPLAQGGEAELSITIVIIPIHGISGISLKGTPSDHQILFF